jgi:putative multiple sugar transport system ATP-binding protein
MPDFILEMRDITKAFPGVKALDNVNFKVRRNHIHALVGENGAGKSTLINIIGGVYTAGTYKGWLNFNGNECRFRGIQDSEKRGISIIHQELTLIPYLSIAENIFLGNERAWHKVIDWDVTIREASELLEKVHLKEDPRGLVKNIGVGKQQLVEIAKALSRKISLLILDEPTAALNEESSRNLLNLLLELKAEGITSVLISHKLNEVSSVADEITILRDGKTIETLTNGVDDIGEDRIIKGMVGREISDRYPVCIREPGEVCLEVKNWNVFHPLDTERQVIHNVSFYARTGEVVGFAGLMGAGRTELAMSIFGKAWGQKITGEILKDGRKIEMKSISHAIDNGIAYVTEDRKSAGLILIDNIKHNISLPNLKKISRRCIIDDELESGSAEDFCRRLNIKSTGILQQARNLSGGNQQKVVLAKWIMAQMDVLILDEPTRGIDVGAKYEIYCIINQLVKEGKCIILISSELPEILGMSDRVYVMSEGHIAGELDRKDASQESIMKCIMQGSMEV